MGQRSLLSLATFLEEQPSDPHPLSPSWKTRTSYLLFLLETADADVSSRALQSVLNASTRTASDSQFQEFIHGPQVGRRASIAARSCLSGDLIRLALPLLPYH